LGKVYKESKGGIGTVEERDKVIDRIVKILAKASNNPSREEAETALLMAQRIMAQHGLAVSDIENDQDVRGKKEVIDEEATDEGRHSWWEKLLASIIADNFRCVSYSEGGSFGQTIIRIIGLREDVIVVKELLSYATNALLWQVKNYIAEKRRYNPNIRTAGLKNDYIEGFLVGLQHKFAKQVSQEGWGLVLTKDQLVIDAVEKAGLRACRHASHERAGSREAFNRGYIDAQKFNDNKRLRA